MELPWNDEADQLLVKKVEEHTDERDQVDWAEVVKSFPARTGKACESRWHKLEHGLVTPAINRDPTFQDLFEELRDNPRTLEQIANKFDSEVTVVKDDIEVNGKSIMGILTLAAEKDSSITIVATGKDAHQALLELEKIVTVEETEQKHKPQTAPLGHRTQVPRGGLAKDISAGKAKRCSS